MTQPSPAFLAAAKDLLGPKGWSDDPKKLAAVSTPWRGTWPGETPFLARPASTEEAAALVKLCAQHRVAITPQGGNTGLVDGGTPHGEICVSMTRMTAVREVDPFNNSMVIEAGATLVTAQETAEKANRLFPLSPRSPGTPTPRGPAWPDPGRHAETLPESPARLGLGDCIVCGRCREAARPRARSCGRLRHQFRDHPGQCGRDGHRRRARHARSAAVER